MVWAGNRPFSTIAGFHWDEDQSGDFFQQKLIFHYNEDQSGDNVELLRQLALRLASLGCLVVAVDIDGETNKATVEDIQVVVRSRRSSSGNIYFTASRKDRTKAFNPPVLFRRLEA